MHVGLRPRLRTRPSLLDLVHKKNIDHISIAVDRIPYLEDDIDPPSVPLPSSPLLLPRSEVTNPLPPPIIIVQDHSEEPAKEPPAAKMPPVSFMSDKGS
jgi:hypothetical protein